MLTAEFKIVKAFVKYCSNEHFTRMAALHSLAFNDKFREDQLSNNFGEYIMKGAFVVILLIYPYTMSNSFFI